MSNTATVIGNLGSDPEIRYTPEGKAIVSFTVADTPRTLDRASGQWKDGTTDWVRVSVFGSLAENVAASLQKGARVIVMGSYKARKYEKDGETKTSRELVANEVAPSLLYAKAEVTRATRNQSGQQNTTPTNNAPANDAFGDDTPF